MNDHEIRERLRPEFRNLYQSFRDLGMDQETALQATKGRGSPHDIIASEQGQIVSAFQGLGLSVNEAETAARGRPAQENADLLKPSVADPNKTVWDGQRMRLTEQDDGNGGDAALDADTVVSLWIESLVDLAGMTNEEAQREVEDRIAARGGSTDNGNDTSSESRRGQLLRESSGKIMSLNGGS